MTPATGLKALSSLMLLAVFWLAVPAWAASTVEVKIGAAHFPPYTVRPEQGADTGLLPQLVDALNRAQQHYRFVLVPTSIQRRFGDFQQGRTDMAIFENPQWGWQQIPHKTVDMGLEDAEVFVARQANGGDPHYFDDLNGKRLALFNGYHYAFAGFNSDPARNPASRERLVPSQRIDQVYHHYALLRPGAPIGEQSFAALLRALRDSGELARIFEPYRITVAAPRD